MKVPIGDALHVVDAARSAASAGETASVLVCVGEGAPSQLVATVRDALVPQSPLVAIDVAAVSACEGVPLAGYDVILAIAGDDATLAAALATRASASNVPCALLVESAVDAPVFEDGAGRAPISVIAGSSSEALLGKLADWLCGSCSHDVTLSAAFAFVRPAETRRLVRACAATNAAVGVFNPLPGADLPIMAANQARMAVDLMRSHGESVVPSALVPALAAVLACSFGSRAVARRLSRTLPPLSPVFRAAVAYGGTVAVGLAASVLAKPLPIQKGGRA